MKIPVLFICCAAHVLAQTAAVPRLGWALGPQPGRVHEVIGVAGAAQLGPPLELGDVRLLALRPGSGLALLVRSDGASGLLRLVPGEQVAAWEPLENALPQAGIAVWSPLGRALVLASAESGRLQVWQFTPDNARLLCELPLAVSRAAVSDAGDVLAEMDGILYHVSPDGSMAVVSQRPAVAFTFLAGSGRYAWLEDGLLRLEGGGEPPAALELESGGDRPVLLFSARGLPLASVQPHSGASRIVAWDEKARPLGQWDLPAVVSQVAPAGADGAVQLISGGGPVWMASLAASSTRVFFVPGLPQEEQQ
ncbi:MAG: hypothetical protein N2036_11125 [Bryobacteraceae bacterium]|nr:hypothetical protein [Bryobacteraceae bacterium]MCX7604614.1 hypothetical protein [Bryobacteraceae bacterium]